jgi:1,4-alpha-glucan branching enzyme
MCGSVAKDVRDASLGDLDRYLIAEGTHLRLHRKLGAHFVRRDGADGVRFAVWAPNARAVRVIGDFNGWNWSANGHVMLHGGDTGIWELFVPGAAPGQRYKFEILADDGTVRHKADPMAMLQESPPRSASVIADPAVFAWTDAEWMDRRRAHDTRREPMATYEVHLGSWTRGIDGGFLTYDQLAEQLIPYVADLGFTHIELMPLAEHPFYGSWGYQPLGLFSPTRRYGDPDGLRRFVDSAHRAGLGVILDWVVSHFPEDDHGLARFDGTCLYEHENLRQRRHPEWNTLIYNYGRTEVVNYLICNALYWLEDFHIDGLRADAVASILYLDYAKAPGEWVPNAYGGNENLEAVSFLRRLNETVYAEHPGTFTVAEESTAWPQVSQPTYLGGLGFGFKWNMGWMNDTLRYMSKDSVHRKYHHGDLTFGLLYAFHENFVLPLSHDEVVHGKGSLLAKMPGDRWQKFANLRTYLTFFYTHPGKKLLFMGGEFGQWREWNHEIGLDWHLLQQVDHQGVQALVRDLNQLYRAVPALHQRDCEGDGFAWLNPHDQDNNVVSYLRFAGDRARFAVVVCNFSPVVRRGYRVGVPQAGYFREILNSDSAFYAGTNIGNGGGLHTDAIGADGHPQSLALILPPLGALILVPA